MGEDPKSSRDAQHCGFLFAATRTNQAQTNPRFRDHALRLVGPLRPSRTKVLPMRLTGFDVSDPDKGTTTSANVSHMLWSCRKMWMCASRRTRRGPVDNVIFHITPRRVNWGQTSSVNQMMVYSACAHQAEPKRKVPSMISREWRGGVEARCLGSQAQVLIAHKHTVRAF